MNETVHTLTEKALATGSMVRIAFLVKVPGVQVPDSFHDSETLALDFGLNAPTPIDDLVCSPFGIGGTLRFGDDFVWCFIPWGAVINIHRHVDEPAPEPKQPTWTPRIIDGGKKGS
jgi:hypothetical protein